MPEREDAMFDCEIAANMKFLSAFFTPYVWQMNPVYVFYNNKSTGMATEPTLEEEKESDYLNTVNSGKPMIWENCTFDSDTDRPPWKNFLSWNIIPPKNESPN